MFGFGYNISARPVRNLLKLECFGLNMSHVYLSKDLEATCLHSRSHSLLPASHYKGEMASTSTRLRPLVTSTPL